MLFFSPSQCDVCELGFVKAGRQCRPALVPPMLAATSLQATLPWYSPAGTPVAAINVTNATGLLNYTLINPQQLAVTLDGAGVVTLTALLERIGTATVAISDAAGGCFVPDSLRNNATLLAQAQLRPSDCNVMVQVTLSAAAFVGCPRPLAVFATPGQQLVNVSWQEPTLPNFISGPVRRSLGNTTSTQAPFAYGLGQHQVLYEADFGSGVVQCGFTVSVQRGFDVQLGQATVDQWPGLTQVLVVSDDAGSQETNLAQVGAINLTLTESVTLEFGTGDGRSLLVSPQVSWLENCSH